MKNLTDDEIEALLGLGGTDEHPLEILGFGHTSEGARRFRAERPDPYPQVADHIRRRLEAHGIYPPATDLTKPGFNAFIHRRGECFVLSSMQEIGLAMFSRIETLFQSSDDAIGAYVSEVANPDYLGPPTRPNKMPT